MQTLNDKNIELIYSSPILRAKESAKIISNKIDRKIIISTEISEVYTPLQEKHITYKELFKKRTYPYLDNFHIKNYGESIEDIFKRVNDLVCEVLRKHKEKNIIFFSHGDPIMIYRYKIESKEIGINDLLDGKEYIPKSGAIKFSFDKSKLLNIKTVNYTESSI